MPTLNHYLSGRSKPSRLPDLGLPPNIERRQRHFPPAAPYRGWDHLGRLYHIHAESKRSWRATLANPPIGSQPSYSANTLRALGSLLADVGKER